MSSFLLEVFFFIIFSLPKFLHSGPPCHSVVGPIKIKFLGRLGKGVRITFWMLFCIQGTLQGIYSGYVPSNLRCLLEARATIKLGLVPDFRI